MVRHLGIVSLAFEWDPKKARANLAKHGVPFEEAASVFGDLMSITIPDTDQSLDEDRFVTVGLSFQARIIAVVHTDRGGTIRIISARLATRRERSDYEEPYG